MSEGTEASREVTLHQVGDPRVDQLRIFAEDGPGPGGANHEYWVYVGDEPLDIHRFQKGPVCEAGVNGETNEALLAIVADRLQCFQSGPMPCRENALALTKIEEALHWLHTRTRRSLAAGVEGRGKP